MHVSRVHHDFQGCFQSVSRKFQENFQGGLVFFLIWGEPPFGTLNKDFCIKLFIF